MPVGAHGVPMFLLCPKFAFWAEPENVIALRPSAPMALDALARIAPGVCAAAIADRYVNSTNDPASIFNMQPPPSDGTSTPGTRSGVSEGRIIVHCLVLHEISSEGVIPVQKTCAGHLDFVAGPKTTEL
jgi:hypothetical protein